MNRTSVYVYPCSVYSHILRHTTNLKANTGFTRKGGTGGTREKGGAGERVTGGNRVSRTMYMFTHVTYVGIYMDI